MTWWATCRGALTPLRFSPAPFKCDFLYVSLCHLGLCFIFLHGLPLFFARNLMVDST